MNRQVNPSVRLTRHQRRFEPVTSLYDETLATPGQTLVLRGRNRQQTISRETDAGYDAFLVPSNAVAPCSGIQTTTQRMPTGIPDCRADGPWPWRSREIEMMWLRPLHATNPWRQRRKIDLVKGHGYLFRIKEKTCLHRQVGIQPSATEVCTGNLVYPFDFEDSAAVADAACQ